MSQSNERRKGKKSLYIAPIMAALIIGIGLFPMVLGQESAPTLNWSTSFTTNADISGCGRSQRSHIIDVDWSSNDIVLATTGASDGNFVIRRLSETDGSTIWLRGYTDDGGDKSCITTSLDQRGRVYLQFGDAHVNEIDSPVLDFETGLDVGAIPQETMFGSFNAQSILSGIYVDTLSDITDDSPDFISLQTTGQLNGGGLSYVESEDLITYNQKCDRTSGFYWHGQWRNDQSDKAFYALRGIDGASGSGTQTIMLMDLTDCSDLKTATFSHVSTTSPGAAYTRVYFINNTVNVLTDKGPNMEVRKYDPDNLSLISVVDAIQATALLLNVIPQDDNHMLVCLGNGADRISKRSDYDFSSVWSLNVDAVTGNLVACALSDDGTIYAAFQNAGTTPDSLIVNSYCCTAPIINAETGGLPPAASESGSSEVVIPPLDEALIDLGQLIGAEPDNPQAMFFWGLILLFVLLLVVGILSYKAHVPALPIMLFMGLAGVIGLSFIGIWPIWVTVMIVIMVAAIITIGISRTVA